MAVDGHSVGLMHQPTEVEDLEIQVRLPLVERSHVDRLMGIKMPTSSGHLVPLSQLVRVELEQSERSIFHKNLMPVVYVTADVGGEFESPVYAIMELSERIEELELPEGYTWSSSPDSSPFTPIGYR